MPKLASFNSMLKHYSAVRPHMTTLLNILASQRRNFKDFRDFRTKGGGSIINGIFEEISEVVDTMSDTGASIFHSIAKGLKHVTNDTVGLVTDVGNDVLGIFDFVWGPSNFGLYVLNFLIVIYLGYKHILEYRMRLRPPELPPRPST